MDACMHSYYFLSSHSFDIRARGYNAIRANSIGWEHARGGVSSLKGVDAVNAAWKPLPSASANSPNAATPMHDTPTKKRFHVFARLLLFSPLTVVKTEFLQ